MNYRFTSIGILSITAFLTTTAKTTWLVENSTYTVDTMYHATVGPGTTLTELKVNGPSGTNNMFYTRIELSNQWVEIRAAKAGNSMRAVETVPDIAKRFNSSEANYFAGINADFFNTKYPYNSLGACISNGQLSNRQTTGDAADIDDYYLCIDESGEPRFARHVTLATEGSVMFPDGQGIICKINALHGTNSLVLYTPQWQFIYNGTTYPVGQTGTNGYCTEVVVKPIDGSRTIWGHSGQLEVIDSPVNGVGNMKIPDGCYVLSGHGTSANAVNNLKKGDVISAYMGFKADNSNFAAREVIGGFPYLLQNGKIWPTHSYPEHLPNKEPRTAVGYNEDKTVMIMLVVDGRNAGGSAGATQSQMAWFMKNLGCRDAMNFDGGGSSTMYIDRLGIRNIPSTSSLDKDREEGEPRVVVNALFAVSTSPVDNEVASIEIVDKYLNLVSGQQYTPTVYGYNKYGALIDKNLTGYKCKISPLIAQTTHNTLTGADGEYSGVLTVEYDNATYSIPVYLNGGGEYVSAGIENVTVDNESDIPYVYYNMQGVKIDNPVDGMPYIIKQGSRVTKQIFKH